MTTDILSMRKAARDEFLKLAQPLGWDVSHAHSDEVTRWLSPMTRGLYFAWLEGRPSAALAVPEADPVERKPLTVSDAEKAFNTWNLSGASEETDAFYRLNAAGKLECAFHDGLRAGEAAHNIKGAA